MEEEVLLPSAEQLNGSHHGQGASTGSIQQEHKSFEESQDGTCKQISSSSFSRLPRSVIEHILHFVNANTFASLTLLNRKWRRISDSSVLYAYHLSRCPSSSLTTGGPVSSARPDDLVSLKSRFFSEIRRNAFDVFLRPRRTLIKLISTSMSSSTAFPQGEAFRFTFSPNAQMILCISSSRIVVLDVTSDPAVVKHELKTSRRPLNATILDDGSLIAVVSSSHQVNIYSLSNEEAKHIQELKLNDIPTALSLSPSGGVLAIAYSDRIEVYAVGEGAMVTERRAVRCDGVDSISFSSDGVMLLGASTDSQNGSLVTITVPFFTDPGTDLSPRDVQIRMWTTQILFPEMIHGYSHACLLPQHAEGEGSWILGFDRRMGAFRAIGANNANAGTTYFVGPTPNNGQQESPPIMLPTTDYGGELVALGFRDSGLWVYGVPNRLDIAIPASEAQTMLNTSHGSQVEESVTLIQDNLERLQWTINKPRTLVSGHKMTDMSGITAARWVRQTHCMFGRRRLAVVAPGGVSRPTIGHEGVPVDDGRVLLLDFERSTKDGDVTEFNIEIGEAEPMMLHEPNSSLDTEVELERRRTRLHRENVTSQRARAAVRDSYPAAVSNSQVLPSVTRRNTVFSISSNGTGNGDQAPPLDAPYDNAQPRSQDTLRRAATAASSSRGRYNPQYHDRWSRIQNRRQIPQVPPIPRLFQIPHESDADNWVPPPPPYTREPDGPLPEYLRRTLLPSMTEPVHRVGPAPSQVRRSQTSRLENMSQDASSRSPLQRLNTVSGSRWARRIRDRETRDEIPRQNSFLRRRASSAGPPAQPINRPPESQQQPPASAGESFPVSSTTALQVQMEPDHLPGNQFGDQPVTNNSTSQQVLGHIVRDMATERNHFSLSASSPNLLVLNSEYSALQNNTQLRSETQRATDRRRQSHDIRLPVTGIPALNRRASTDPTLASSQDPNELWRRRIEEWNEQTIHERGRRRNKCIVM